MTTTSNTSQNQQKNKTPNTNPNAYNPDNTTNKRKELRARTTPPAGTTSNANRITLPAFSESTTTGLAGPSFSSGGFSTFPATDA